MPAYNSAEHDRKHSRIILQKEAAEHSLRTMTDRHVGVFLSFPSGAYGSWSLAGGSISERGGPTVGCFGRGPPLESIDYFSLPVSLLYSFLADKSNGSPLCLDAICS